MHRRTVITGALGALTVAALPATGQAATADTLVAAYKACTENTLDLNRYAQSLAQAGWTQIADAPTLTVAARVLGDSLAVGPYLVPGKAHILDPGLRARSRANVESSVVNFAKAPFRSQTWTVSDTGGSSYINIRQGLRDTPIWCAAATSDPTGGRAFLETVWPNAPEIQAGEPFLQAVARHKKTPLFRPAISVSVTLTEFDRAAVETQFAPPFEAAAGFLIVSKPGR